MPALTPHVSVVGGRLSVLRPDPIISLGMRSLDSGWSSCEYGDHPQEQRTTDNKQRTRPLHGVLIALGQVSAHLPEETHIHSNAHLSCQVSVIGCQSQDRIQS